MKHSFMKTIDGIRLLEVSKNKLIGKTKYKYVREYLYDKKENLYYANLPKYKASLWSNDIRECAKFIDLILIKYNRNPINILKQKQ